jgi:dipeptidyl aminopeptidase/acylaminoacyl peptidase
MTSARRFEQDLPALLDDLYVAGMPDYRDDLVATTARTPQRPAWTFPERWLPMDLATRRLPFAAVPLRALIVLALILILAAAALLLSVGSRHPLPAPFGPARNGPLAYTGSDAIFVRDTPDAPERVLIPGKAGKVEFSGFSPDGTRLLFVRTIDGSDYLFVAEADGTGERKVLPSVLHDAYLAWGPDGRTVAISDEIDAVRKVMLVHLDGAPPTIVDLGDARPTDMAWRPPTGAELLIRATTHGGGQDFFLVRADGTLIRSFGLPSPSPFGPDWENSGPAWSPDGAFLAYNRVEPLDGDPPGHFRVHVIRADGTGDVTLPGPSEPLVQEAWPVWSPDGRWIAVEHFVFGDPGEDWMALLPSDGKAPARDLLPRGPGAQDGGIVKTWTPDGSRVVAYNRGTRETFLIDPVTGASEKAAWSAAAEPDYRRLAP